MIIQIEGAKCGVYSYLYLLGKLCPRKTTELYIYFAEWLNETLTMIESIIRKVAYIPKWNQSQNIVCGIIKIDSSAIYTPRSFSYSDNN